MNIRDMTDADLPTALALNNANIPAVSEIDLAELARLKRLAQDHGGAALSAVVDDQLAGFALVLTPGQDYASLNYRWFSEHFDRFVYLDRIAVDATRQRSGAGRAIYAELRSRYTGVWPVLTCEVNVKPLNQGSLDFHAALGFREVGQQDTSPSEDGSGMKRVSLLALDL